MKVILKVAKTELRTLFYSPIAWFLMIVFLVQCGSVYFTLLQTVARNQEMSGSQNGFFMSITSFIYLSNAGLFVKVIENLYLYVPLLTMSLISRELSSGTVKLLYSSPVRVSEIVFGKYLAMLAYSVLLVLVVGIFLFAGMFHIEHPQTGMLFSAMLAFFLLLCAYSAIGLFMSSLTSYQVVAAVATFVMFGILSYIGKVWQDLGFVRELTYFLSINGRTQNMMSGLITTKDLIYFLVIIAMFLAFAILKIKGGMESRSGMVKAGRYFFVIAAGLFVGYIFSLPRFIAYFDVTYDKGKTLTPRVQRIIADLGKEPLEVTNYANVLDYKFYLGHPGAYNQNLARWESYLRFKPNIALKTVLYYDSVPGETQKKLKGKKTLKEQAELYAKSMDIPFSDFLSPAQIRRQINLLPENNKFVMQLRWKNRTTFLRVFDDMRVWPSETEVAAALLRLQQATLPKIAFITGDLERDINKLGDRDYKTITNIPSFRQSLMNQGFDFVSLTLDAQDIPADISAVVLADPKLSLSPVALSKIRSYIARGGNMLIAGEPGKQAVLNPLLGELGVQMEKGIIIQESKNELPNHILAYVQPAAGSFYKPLIDQVIRDSVRLTMPGVVSLSYKQNGPFTFNSLVQTDGHTSWNRILPLDLENMIVAKQSTGNMGSSERGSDITGTVTFSAKQGDVRGPHTTVIGLSRKINGKQQHIVVAGDADFISNKELTRSGTANFLFSTSLFRWVSNGEFPVDTSRPDYKDKKVTLNLSELKTRRILLLWLTPGLLLVCGAVLLIRRKRK